MSVSSSGCFTLEEINLLSHKAGGWVGLRAGLDTVEKTDLLPLPGIDLLFVGHPACSVIAIPTELTGSVDSRAGYKRTQTVLLFRLYHRDTKYALLKNKRIFNTVLLSSVWVLKRNFSQKIDNHLAINCI
jgi:hypothetical protein